jgi:hypothetical protein
MSGGGGIKKQFFDVIVNKPVQVYLIGGAFLYAIRTYQTQITYNYWFGKNEYERRLEKGGF